MSESVLCQHFTSVVKFQSIAASMEIADYVLVVCQYPEKSVCSHFWRKKGSKRSLPGVSLSFPCPHVTTSRVRPPTKSSIE